MRNKKETNYAGIILVALLAISLTACASVPKDRYNTQKGAAIGAGLGALLGQAIGKDTEGTLLGAGIGTVVGAIAGNATDQGNQAVRDAAQLDKRVVYYDNQGSAVEAIPRYDRQQSTNCRKVAKRVWDRGTLKSETIEEVCEGEKNSSDY